MQLQGPERIVFPNKITVSTVSPELGFSFMYSERDHVVKGCFLK